MSDINWGIDKYYDLLNLRRSNNNQMYYIENDGFYDIYLRHNGLTFLLSLEKETDESDDFEANRKQFCNKEVKYNSPGIPSHNFDDKTSWKYGQYNSLFNYDVEQGKVVYPSEFLCITDKDLTFTNGQKIKFVIWQTQDGTALPILHPIVETITSATSSTIFDVSDGSLFNEGDHVKVGSEFSVIDTINSNTITLLYALQGTPDIDTQIRITNPTAFGVEPFFNPNNNVFTGWYHYYSDGVLDIWLWFVNGVVKYKASSFTYGDLDLIYSLSDQFYEKNVTIKSLFNYIQKEIILSLCSSLNERIEIYIDDNVELVNPNNVDCYMKILFKSYDEW